MYCAKSYGHPARDASDAAADFECSFFARIESHFFEEWSYVEIIVRLAGGEERVLFVRNVGPVDVGAGIFARAGVPIAADGVEPGFFGVGRCVGHAAFRIFYERHQRRVHLMTSKVNSINFPRITKLR